MTLKELAEVAGVSIETVRRTAKESFPDKFKNGVRTIFDEKQSIEIMRDVSKKNMVSMQNEKLPTQIEELPTQNVEVIAQAVAMAMQTVMMPMMEKMMSLNNKPLQIEQKEDYFSLLAYCTLHSIKTNRSENAMHGRALKKMAVEKNLTIRNIPDERYGKVNSYPVDILNEYFSE